MATKYAQVSGNWSDDTSVWYDAETGGNVVSHPVEGDNAVINAGVTVSLDNESGVIVVGDDSGDALTINGTLQRTNSATTQLEMKFKGNVVVNNGGIFKVGDAVNPINKDYGVTIKINYSDSLADEKYRFTVNSNGQLILQGENYTQQAILTSNAASGATDIYVDDITGWRVGDNLVIECSDTSWLCAEYRNEERSIVAIDTVNKKITLNSGLAYAHTAGWNVYNITCAITFQADTQGYRAKLVLDSGCSADIDFVRFNYLGDDGYYYNAIDRYTSFYTKYGGIEIKDVGAHLDNVVMYRGEETFVSIRAEGWQGSNWFLFAASGEQKYKNTKLTNLHSLSFSPGAESFWYCGGVPGTEIDGLRHNGDASGWFDAPQFLRNAKIYQCCHNVWSEIRYVCPASKVQEYYWENIEIKYSKHGIQIYNGAKVYITGLNMEGVSTPITIMGNGFLCADNVTSYGVTWLNFFGDNGGYITDTNGKVKGMYGYYGESSAFGIAGRGGDGSCLVLDPTDPDNYLLARASDFSQHFTQFPVNSGKTITLSFYVKVSASGFDGDLQISAQGCGIDYSWTSVNLTGADSDWVQRSFVLGTTTDKGFVRLKIRAKDGATVSGDIYLDDFAISEA